MKPTTKAFLDDILAVCRAHKLILYVERDELEVWPLGPDEDDDEAVTQIKGAADMTED